MELSELIKKVRQIEIKTKKLSNELFSGNYASTFKGRGMSFSEVRAYTFGDDVRNIDWNVTSRSQEPYIKEYEEERELTFMIMIDVSASMHYGSGKSNKKDIATEIAATLAFSALKNNDKVGIIFFSDRIEKYIPPKKGRSHILRIIRELIETEADSSKTDVGEALRFFQNSNKKKCVTFILSDFLDSREFDKELSLVSLRHQVYGIHFKDTSELDFPNLGLIQVLDAETNQTKWIDTSVTSFKENLKEQRMSLENSMKKNFNKRGAKFCGVSTDDTYIPIISKMFAGN